jgi:hypothetical protein
MICRRGRGNDRTLQSHRSCSRWRPDRAHDFPRCRWAV